MTQQGYYTDVHLTSVMSTQITDKWSTDYAKPMENQKHTKQPPVVLYVV